MDHWWRDNSNPNANIWTNTGNITSKWPTSPTSSGSVIQGSFGLAGNDSKGNIIQGNVEAVVQHTGTVNHYWRDDSDPTFPWHFGATTTTNAYV